MLRILGCLIGLSSLWAGAPTAQQPVLLKADEITYDGAHKKIHADGHIQVQATQNGQTRTLIANYLDYDLTQKRIQARGHVVLFEPDGSIIQVDAIELTDDFAHGIMHAMRMLTQDNAYLVAQTGERKEGQYTTLKKGAYTPCKLCQTGLIKEPLWQIKATTIEHDTQSKTVTYYNARLEFKGIPIFYLPYFYHPDPSVKRQSGLLFPTYGMSSNFGKSISTPYYYVIDKNRDLTFTPTFFEKEGAVYTTEYRHRYRNGDARLAGSYTQTRSISKKNVTHQAYNGPRDPHRERWHVANLVRYDMDDSRHMVLDINRASDTTYLTRYPIAHQSPAFIQSRNLVSSFTVEQLHDASYLGVQGYMFQTDTPKTTPLVHPLARMNVTSNPDRFGGYTSWDSSFLSMSRDVPQAGRYGNKMNRVSSGLSWRLPYTTRNGQLITTTLSARLDGYDTHRYQRNADLKTKTERQAGRFYPCGSLDWRYPFQRRFTSHDWLIQPTATYVGSPRNLNNKNIPNEDSNSFELDDTTLFLPNRFDGVDRVDSGHRVVGGLDQTLYFPKQRLVNVFVGQTARLDNRQVVRPQWGEDSKYSDYIVRTKVKPVSWLALRYRSALYRKPIRPRYSEWGSTLGNDDYQLNVAHLFLNRRATYKNEDVSQLTGSVKAKVYENWSTSLGQVRNLKRKRGGSSLVNFASLNYGDECFKLDLVLYRTSYHDRDIKPNAGFLVQFTFKNLGSYAPVSGGLLSAPSSPLTRIS
jgi:LPS-assembly protein